tara:strand:- start:16214 stop:16891 length:678 start_codon:yes stop_codon:yes gene_type:complete
VYSDYEHRATPLISEHGVLGKLLRLLRWTVTLCVLVLIVDLVCVAILWDDGIDSLREVIVAERRILRLSDDAEADLFLDTSVALAYDWVFLKTGLGNWLSTTRIGPTANAINSGRVILDTAVIGLELFAARLAILVLSLPLFAAMGGAAISDGIYGWLMRRTSGSRESGFIYHRAKRIGPALMIMLWVVYLAPPVPMDPRWVIPPFIVLFTVALRLRVSYFKKHL